MNVYMKVDNKFDDSCYTTFASQSAHGITRLMACESQKYFYSSGASNRPKMSNTGHQDVIFWSCLLLTKSRLSTALQMC